MKLRPLHDWVVVQIPPQPAEKKIGSIIVTTENKNQVLVGVVLAVGPGKRLPSGAREPIGVEVGEDVAFFSANFDTSAGEQLTDTIQRYQEGIGMIRAKDILFATLPGVEIDV